MDDKRRIESAAAAATGEAPIQGPPITPDVLRNSKTLQCSCGGHIFLNGIVVKQVSKILSPNGQDMEIPVQVIYCADCGKILPELDKDNILPDKIKSKPISKIKLTK